MNATTSLTAIRIDASANCVRLVDTVLVDIDSIDDAVAISFANTLVNDTEVYHSQNIAMRGRGLEKVVHAQFVNGVVEARKRRKISEQAEVTKEKKSKLGELKRIKLRIRHNSQLIVEEFDVDLGLLSLPGSSILDIANGLVKDLDLSEGFGPMIMATILHQIQGLELLDDDVLTGINVLTGSEREIVAAANKMVKKGEEVGEVTVEIGRKVIEEENVKDFLSKTTKNFAPKGGEAKSSRR